MEIFIKKERENLKKTKWKSEWNPLGKRNNNNKTDSQILN